MNTLMAIQTLVDLTNAAMTLLQKSQQISAVISKAQSEGRDITTAEMEEIIKEDDSARIALNAAILKHGG